MAISITMPRFVNTELGLNTSYPTTDDRCQIKNIIEQRYKKRTFIENDSTAIAIAEHKFGTAKNTNDVLVINLNWGVGLGMIINAKLFRGSRGLAGEFTHIPLSNLNKLCSCGKRGCLEVEATLEAALSYVIEKLNNGETSILTNKKENLELNNLLDVASNGDQLAIESFGSIGYALGKGTAKDSYETGIKQSIEFYYNINAMNQNSDGTSYSPKTKPTDAQITSYLTKVKINYTGSLQEKIATQQWINFGIIQAQHAWAEYRRTGYPKLTFIRDESSLQSPLPPSRLLYPENERTYNSQNYEAVKSKDKLDIKVFWHTK